VLITKWELSGRKSKKYEKFIFTEALAIEARSKRALKAVIALVVLDPRLNEN